MEIWKDIPGYEGLYEVSNKGRVRSFHYGKERIMKLISNSVGYYKISLFKGGLYKRMYVHRLVAQAFIPNPDELKEVNHKDENPGNNSVDNLEWCDHKYNMKYGTARERAREKKIDRGIWFLNSKEHKKEYYNRWKEENKEKIKEYHREYLREWRKRKRIG